MTKRKKILLSILGLVAAVLLGLAIAVAVVYRRATTTPDYWQVVNLAEPTVARDAAAFEQWLSSEFTQHRPNVETWQIELEADDVNRWLATRLPGWAANQGFELPGWLGHPMVAIQPDRFIVAGQVQQDDQSHIVSLTYQPTTPPHEQPIAMELTGVYVGRQRIADNVDELIELIETFVDVSKFDQRQLDDLRGRVQTVTLAGDLGDGRRVEVIGIDLRPGKMLLTCRTQRAAP